MIKELQKFGLWILRQDDSLIGKLQHRFSWANHLSKQISCEYYIRLCFSSIQCQPTKLKSEAIHLFFKKLAAIQIDLTVKLMEELRDTAIPLQYAETKEARFGCDQRNTDVGELSGFDKWAKSQKSILAGKLFHGVFQKSSRRHRRRHASISSHVTFAGTPSSTYHQESGMLARISANFGKIASSFLA